MTDFFETYQGQFEILLMVGLAMLLGGVIGLERELANKPAGLRTHMLVAGTAALFVALGTLIINDFSADIGEDVVRSDPVRILEAIVTGISFLGAGTIIRDRSKGRVEGLTTAASLLFASAIGGTVGVRQYVLAVGAVILVLITLSVLGVVGRFLPPRSPDAREEADSRD
ncbi:MAG: MgtC/SapB family protein [Anaerolineae bacterium]|nr:MgtC/SapB family protein [Anaerolineae bacterium]